MTALTPRLFSKFFFPLQLRFPKPRVVSSAEFQQCYIVVDLCLIIEFATYYSLCL